MPTTPMAHSKLPSRTRKGRAAKETAVSILDVQSARTLARRFANATGTTPRQGLISQRLALAQRLLETTNLSIEQIAERCGFGTGSALREQFARHLQTRPLAYRRSFRQRTAP